MIELEEDHESDRQFLSRIRFVKTARPKWHMRLKVSQQINIKALGTGP